MKKVIIYTIVLSLFLLVMFFVIPNRNNQLFQYKDFNFDEAWGSISGGLLGTYSTNNGTNILGSPYALSLGFKLGELGPVTVEILELRLINYEDGKVVYESSESLKERFGLDSTGETAAYFLLQNINLKYGDISIEVKYKLEYPDSGHVYQYNGKLERDYKEFKSNIFWRRLMGV